MKNYAIKLSAERLNEMARDYNILVNLRYFSEALPELTCSDFVKVQNKALDFEETAEGEIVLVERKKESWED